MGPGTVAGAGTGLSRLWKKPDIGRKRPPCRNISMAQGLGEYDVIELDGGHETLFMNPGAIAEGLLKALK